MAYYKTTRVRSSAYAKRSTPLQVITKAYKTARLPVPDWGESGIEALAAKESDTENVAREYAKAVYNGHSQEKALTAAVEALTQAHAIFLLQEHAGRHLGQLQTDELPDLEKQALKDIEPIFTQVIERFTAAVEELPQQNPLDEITALRAQKADQWHTAVNTLRVLGGFSIAAPKELYQDNSEVWRILPLVTLPDTTPEKVYQGRNGKAVPAPNEGTERKETREAIRKLAADCRKGIDHTLVRVARHQYGPDIGFQLADRSELTRRITSAENAQHTQLVGAPIVDGQLAG